MIIAVDVFDNKLEMAKRMGATHTINASADDPLPRIVALAEGGVDYAFEVIGLPEVVVQAFESIARHRRDGQDASMAHSTVNTLGLFVGKTLTGAPYGSSRPRVDMPMLVDLYMSGKLKLDELVSRSYPLEQINDAFDAMKKGEVARSIIEF
jgi:S-(hydroxymethyl)glutathione dehydrogenase/alcohol dehydrogenase